MVEEQLWRIILLYIYFCRKNLIAKIDLLEKGTPIRFHFHFQKALK